MAGLATTYVVYNESRIAVPAAESVSRVLDRYGVALSEPQLSQIQRYIACLVFWNQRVSLTSVTDLEEILERHFAESLIGVPLIGSPEGRLADVGTGAGFPGLALKIALPNLQVFLIERNTKKCAYLSEAIRFLNLDRVTVIRSEFESISPAEPKFDSIAARAIGSHKDLLRWATGRLTPNGKVLLWLGEKDSLSLSQTTNWRWDPPISIPHSQSRVILVGSPMF